MKIYLSHSTLTSPTISNPTITGQAGFADGTAAAPSISFTADLDTGFYRVSSGNLGWSSNGTEHIRAEGDSLRFTSGTLLRWTPAGDINASPDLSLNRDAANTFAQRNGPNAQAFRVYNTFTDASNYERLTLKGTAGANVELTAETAGTGADNLDVKLTPAGTGGIQLTSGTPKLDRTITATGTTGAQTINKMAGTVNFAAAATSLVVTNSLVNTSSIVFCVIRTDDATARLANVVPAAGSFTINLTAAATAETSVGFWVTN